MGKGTKIEWAHNTLNFWIGCTAVSPGCANCYAEAQAARYNWTPQGWGPGKPRRRTAPSTWGTAYRWHRQNMAMGQRERVFVNSLSDIFDEDPAVPDFWRAEAFHLMRECTSFDYLLVTKRLGDLTETWCKWLTENGVRFALLASVENQEWAEKRIPRLLEIPATWHGLSVEPMLGPVDPTDIWLPETDVKLNAFTGHQWGAVDGDGVSMDGPKLDWVIVGGESHKEPGKARVFDRQWGTDMARQCAAAGVAYFFKQEGSNVAGLGGVPVTNINKGQDKSLWAPWMVQQFPKGMATKPGETSLG